MSYFQTSGIFCVHHLTLLVDINVIVRAFKTQNQINNYSKTKSTTTLNISLVSKRISQTMCFFENGLQKCHDVYDF